MSELALHPALKLAAGLVIAFLLLPVAVVVLAAFSQTAYLTIPPQGLTLRWFAEVFRNPAYGDAIVLSLEIAVLATALAFALAVPAGYALHHRWVRGSQTVAALLMSPLIFPGVVIGVALLQYLSLLGLRGNVLVLVLVHAVIVTPYLIRTFLAGMAGLDPALEEAARVLGASRAGAFLLVGLPGLRASLLAGIVFALITSFDEVPITVFLLPPGQATLPVTIFTAIDQGVDPSVAAISTLMIAGTAALLVVAERLGGAGRLL